jgi:hypothetical protein
MLQQKKKLPTRMTMTTKGLCLQICKLEILAPRMILLRDQVKAQAVLLASRQKQVAVTKVAAAGAPAVEELAALGSIGVAVKAPVAQQREASQQRRLGIRRLHCSE